MDMLRTGAAWLADQLAENAAVTVTYVRQNTRIQVSATVSSSQFQAADGNGVVEVWESRDYMVRVSDFPFREPARGDRIIETVGDVTTTYEVVTPRGVPLFHYADAFRHSMKIHAVAVKSRGLDAPATA